MSEICFRSDGPIKRGLKPFAQGIVWITNLKTGRRIESIGKGHAFVDSGASLSLITEKVFEKMKAETGEIAAKDAKIMTANGWKDVKVVDDVEICMAGCCYRGQVVVSDKDSIPSDLLLGMDWLTQSKASMDFKNSTIRCGLRKARTIPMKMVR